MPEQRTQMPRSKRSAAGNNFPDLQKIIMAGTLAERAARQWTHTAEKHIDFHP